MDEPTPMEISSSKSRNLKGKYIVFSPPVAAKTIKFRRPFTISTTKQHVLIEDDATKSTSQQNDKAQLSKQPIKIIDISTPPHETNPTFKRLWRKLKDAKK
jgi:hypothetical protein